MTLYLEPIGLLAGATAARAVADGDALPLAGGPCAFTHTERIERGGGVSQSVRLTADAVRRQAEVEPALAAILDRLTAPRPPFGGLAMDAAVPYLMGIVNVTPDS
ncbi:MAG: dihydropteroate synthase, partial [Alphaproteobacteria bacterium]